MLDIVSISGTYQFTKSEMWKLEGDWNMKAEGGSIQNESLQGSDMYT
jgi:hypothetical protein